MLVATISRAVTLAQVDTAQGLHDQGQRAPRAGIEKQSFVAATARENLAHGKAVPVAVIRQHQRER